MTLPVVWIPEADADLDADLKEAFAWYESIRRDLAVHFALAVEAAVEVIAFQTGHSEIRRAGIRRFPYGLFFTVESNRIVSLPACMGSAIRNGGNFGAVSIEVLISPRPEAVNLGDRKPSMG